MHLVFLFALSVMCTITSCAFELELCSSDSDCDDGSRCSTVGSDRVCINDEPKLSGDTGVGIDFSDGIDSTMISPDGGNENNSQVCLGASCTKDQFEENDDPDNAYNLQSDAGCFRDRDEFEARDFSIDATLCAIDDGDWYTFRYAFCALRKKLIVEVYPKNDCSGEEYDVRVEGYDCNEPNPSVQCRSLEDGAKRISVLLDTDDDLRADFIKFGVVPLQDETAFDYRITARVEE